MEFTYVPLYYFATAFIVEGQKENFRGARNNFIPKFENHLDNYLQYRNSEDMNARITQTAHMMKGCEEHLKNLIAKDTIPSDTLIKDIMVTDTVVKGNDTKDLIAKGNSIKDTLVRNHVIRDTLRNKVPEAVNIDEIYQQKIEIKE